MNVASLDLCKELYELSGWKDCDLLWRWYLNWLDDTETEPELVMKRGHMNVAAPFKVPAYDLGYLLRKLPAYLAEKRDKRKLLTPENSRLYWFTLQKYPQELEGGEHLIDEWCCSYDSVEAGSGVYSTDKFDASTFADTPEDAACKLAIELFKTGVLTAEQSEAHSKPKTKETK